ncbi:partial ATP-dependent DNA helicase Rep, partial [Patescibacteria group bacterium]
NERHISLFNASYEIGLSQHLSDKYRHRLEQFNDWLLKTQKRLNQGNTFDEFNTVLEEIGYSHYLKEDSKSDKTAERRMRNVKDLIAWLKRIAESESEEKSLSEVVAKIMLMDILERNEEEQSHDQVSLMTLHAAKGLEFPHVFLIGMEENILPHQTSIETDNIEEERRLAYVGITRAQKTCTFSYCTHRKRYGETVACEPSRFLLELPESELEWLSKKPLDSEAAKERGKAHLEALKMMLS